MIIEDLELDTEYGVKRYEIDGLLAEFLFSPENLQKVGTDNINVVIDIYSSVPIWRDQKRNPNGYYSTLANIPVTYDNFYPYYDLEAEYTDTVFVYTLSSNCSHEHGFSHKRFQNYVRLKLDEFTL